MHTKLELRLARESAEQDRKIRELQTENKWLKEWAYESLGMHFNKKCDACKSNQKENEIRADMLEQALKDTK